MNKFYAQGKEVTSGEHEEIVSGKSDKLIRCPNNLPGICLVYLSDHINTIGNELDKKDPLLIRVLDEIGIPISKTYIVQIFNEPKAPLINAVKGMVYGYW